MTTAPTTARATPRLSVSSAPQADQPYWGDLVTWQAAQSALRGAVELSHHLIGGMLPQVNTAGRVSVAEGLCLRCGGALVVAFDTGGPFISGRARGAVCIPRDRWWTDSGVEATVTRRAFAARTDPAFVGYALAAYARSRQAYDTGFDLARALELGVSPHTRATVDRLALYPLPTGEARATDPAVQEMARATGIDSALLARILAEARAAVAGEQGRRTVAAREEEITTVRAALVRVERERAALQERLDGLLALRDDR